MTICHYCQTLHKPEIYIVWSSNGDRSELSNRGAALAYGLLFPFIQTSLERWATTPFSQSADIQGFIDGFLSTWTLKSFDGNSVYTRKLTGYIVDGIFYLRTQHLVFLPRALKKLGSEPPALFRSIKLCSATHCAVLLRVREAKLGKRSSGSVSGVVSATQ